MEKIEGLRFKKTAQKIFPDQNSGESWVMATILQLKVTKRRLFDKMSLEHWKRYTFATTVEPLYNKTSG